jgi:hypothetical protein
MEMVRFYNARLISNSPQMRVLRHDAKEVASSSPLASPLTAESVLDSNDEQKELSHRPDKFMDDEGKSGGKLQSNIGKSAEEKKDDDADLYLKAQSRNASVVEELGQIQYVFSDKTGTLTCNEVFTLFEYWRWFLPHHAASE